MTYRKTRPKRDDFVRRVDFEKSRTTTGESVVKWLEWLIKDRGATIEDLTLTIEPKMTVRNVKPKVKGRKPRKRKPGPKKSTGRQSHEDARRQQWRESKRRARARAKAEKGK